jgi:O-antigen/teichoic acid export membrane protein
VLNRLKSKSEFSRNVLTLMTGTTIAQALPIASAPILTRIYTPEDFGLFAFYFAIVSILSVLATARYEMAIVLPKRTSHAFQLVILSWLISAVVSVFLALFIWFFEKQIVSLLDSPALSNWLYFIPVSIFLTGLYQSLYYWFNRKKEYKTMANSRIVQSGAMVAIQILLGWLSKVGASGLIVGQIVGQALSVIVMSKTFVQETKIIHKPAKFKQYILAKRYSSFPKFMVPAHLMNIFSVQSPNIMINIFYSAASAGYFVLVQRVVAAPMSIIGSSIADVFRKEADVEIKANGECFVLFKNTLKKLLLISTIPFVIFFIFAPGLFEVVFGAPWREAGDYARILVPMFFLQFVASPLSAMYIVRERQKSYLLVQVMLAICVILSFFMESIEGAIMIISISFSLVYILMITKSLKLSMRNPS